MPIILYEYTGPGLLRPLYHVVDAALPDANDCVERMRREHEEKSGGPVAVEKIGEANGSIKSLSVWLQLKIKERLEQA